MCKRDEREMHLPLFFDGFEVDWRSSSEIRFACRMISSNLSFETPSISASDCGD